MDSLKDELGPEYDEQYEYWLEQQEGEDVAWNFTNLTKHTRTF